MFQRISNSLIARITAISIVMVMLTLLLSGVSLLWSYEASLRRIADNHITAYTDQFIADITVQNGQVALKEEAALARIPRYWQVSARGNNLYKSEQLKNWVTPKPEDLRAPQHFTFTDSAGAVVDAVQITYLFPGDVPVTLIFGLEKKIVDTYLAQERKHLETPLLQILLIEGILLVGLSFLLTRYSITPVKAVHKAIQAIREGREQRIQGHYPNEISELTSEINHLLEYNSGMIARHREFSSNLAHSLKTPMTVIQNESDLTIIRAKAESMLHIIERSLARVHAAPTTGLPSATVTVLPVIEDIAEGFARVYGKSAEIEYPEHISFRGDKADLYEILGNIIENACKFAASKIRIRNEDGAIIVEDDGVGIAAANRKEVLERGTRLDTSKPGTGIGLAIAKDIIELYKGSIALDTSDLSGLKVIIRLPVR